ncbi:hypothetical protein Poli38472_008102 [Pythium oligandrum]|uniref:HTH myb-type domain-containing protein n=1 Tax=Pythium oligandrum TaxID=41045 RepID=A0A8K1FIX3_PYTOL|nr:hypothetical protein Poli38472_008102 [Pythium oligandrum]|eukprot:TMW65460.1 hypothetical protein Poli38472_008102 [Pythium oligandrum]
MTISNRVQSSMFTSAELIRLPPTFLKYYEVRQKMHGEDQVPVRRVNLWSREEHERFLHALELCPKGPWKVIAAMVGTKTTRQTMTHAQTYRQIIARRKKVHPASLQPLPLPVVQVEQPLVTLTRLVPLVGDWCSTFCRCQNKKRSTVLLQRLPNLLMR